jgi:hypothetical protein
MDKTISINDLHLQCCKTLYEEKREKNISLKKEPLPAADAHPFAHRPRQLAPAAERRGAVRWSSEQRGERGRTANGGEE